MDPIKFNKDLHDWQDKVDRRAIEFKFAANLERLERELRQSVKIQSTIAELKRNIGVT